MRCAVETDRGAVQQPWALYKNFPVALDSHDWSMVTMVSRIFRPLLFMLAASTENQLIRQIEYLKAENQMLRKRVGKRVNLASYEKALLLKLASVGLGFSIMPLV